MDIHPLTVQLALDLDRIYGLVPASEAPDCVEAVERQIADELRDAVLTSLEVLEPRVVRLATHGFVFAGSPYEIVVDYRDILRDDTVGVLVAPVRGTDHTPRPLVGRCKIRGNGKYRTANVIVPPHFSPHLDMLAELTQRFYETGYAWLDEFLQTKVRELESSMVVELYREIRVVFAGKQDLSNLIWLVLIQEDHGLYIFDQKATTTIISSLSTHRGKSRQSAVSLFSGLLTSEVPFAQMFSRHAIPTGDCLHCDLAVSEYAGSEPLYTVAEHVLYKSSITKSTVASILPLAREEQPYLIAAFPTSHEAEILPTLRDHTSEISRLFDVHKSRARALLKNLRATSRMPLLPPGKTGEFLGGFIKGTLGL